MPSRACHRGFRSFVLAAFTQPDHSHRPGPCAGDAVSCCAGVMLCDDVLLLIIWQQPVGQQHAAVLLSAIGMVSLHMPTNHVHVLSQQYC